MTPRLVAAALAALGSASSASPPPERPTQWLPERIQAPAVFCAGGMALALVPGESLQVAARRPWAFVELGPLTRLERPGGTFEIQWPALAHDDAEAGAAVHGSARMELVAIAEDTWALSLQPDRARHEAAGDLDGALRMLAVRFPVSTQSSAGLDLARRLVFLDEGDRRCTARAGAPEGAAGPG